LINGKDITANRTKKKQGENNPLVDNVYSLQAKYKKDFAAY